ncbi:MAG: HD domain-containing protein [Anaerolineales bacterium]|nr:HD domain-containing protein [Anaerolineales bacterium]
MDTNNRLQKIADFVRTRQQETYHQHADRTELDRHLVHLDYRWRHTLRVSQWGKVIAEAEVADVELVVAACLLHDVASFAVMDDDHDHGRVGAEIARPLLVELGYTPQQVETIYYAVAAHVDVENPETLEARVVTDADNIDRFGAYRVLYWCLPDIDDYDKLAEKLRRRIERLEGYRANSPLCTPTGQKLFAEQLDFQIAFFRKFVKEHELSTLPQI